MCGLCGVFSWDPDLAPPRAAAAVRTMSALMARRGPDDQGAWSDPAGRLHLGFRRLAVLDPSPAGHQPMLSASGRSVLVFNGELYNFPELRRELSQAGTRFRSTGDTEVLLAALERWGEAALPRLNGMFALAWYRIPERSLVLARDHAGIKPLYYGAPPGAPGLVFASQYDALLRGPWGVPGRVRPDVLRLYLRLHHIPPPYGLLDGTHQLRPGHLLRVDAAGRREERAWWRLPRRPRAELRGPAARERLRATLDAAVRRQRLADVPLGVFLSGGVDSPLVSAIARAQAGPQLQAFTLGNPGWRQDESADARAYGRALGLELHLLNADGARAASAMDAVFAAQHEPLGDFSILPALLLSGFARERVTVALSGDGGDELFFGYERPGSLLRNGADFRWPRALRLALYAAGKTRLAPRRSDTIVFGTPGDYYREVNMRLDDATLTRLAPGLPPLPPLEAYRWEGYRGEEDLLHFARWAEFHGQLQRGLKKVDMASMHHALEVRVPLLDREVLDLSLRLDPFASLRAGRRKALLRDLLGRHVPPRLIPEPKRGFAVPLGEWLRGPLRERVEDAIAGDPFPAGLFDPRALRRWWSEHDSGRRDHKWGLWTFLCLQGWARTHLEPARTARAAPPADPVLHP